MRHAKVLFYTENQECDMCDQVKDGCVIDTLGNDCLSICIDCLKEIINDYEKISDWQTSKI